MREAEKAEWLDGSRGNKAGKCMALYATLHMPCTTMLPAVEPPLGQGETADPHV